MLSRWDPFQEIMTLRDQFDRFFDDFIANSGNGKQSKLWSLPIDLIEMDDQYVVKASLPGVNPDHLEITISNNVLTIKGETKPEEDFMNAHYLLRERWFGCFQRRITLPAKVNEDQIEANYDAGVLKLILPKSEEARPTRIAIQSEAHPKLLEGAVKETT